LSFWAVSRYCAFEAAQVFLRQHLLDGGFVFLGEVGVLVELGLEPLDFLEVVDEGGAGGVALQVGTAEGVQSRPWDFMKLSSFCTAVSSF
jgi:hypothetical protein